MTGGTDAASWRAPAALGLAVGLGGLIVLGPVGGAAGLLAGAVAARRARAVLVAAAVTLSASAALTILEAPLSESRISTFPVDRPLAELFAAIATVLLLAGLAGIISSRDQIPAPSPPGARLDGAAPRVPTSAIAAVTAATVLGALLLWGLGDRRWEAAALPFAIAALGIGGALIFLSRSKWGARSR